MKIDRQAVYDKYNGHCAYCGQEITLKQMQVDHYYPQRAPNLARHYGGIIDIHCMDNLMPACRQCNHYKRAEQPENFRKVMLTLHERIQEIYINKVGINFGMVTVQPFNGQFYFEKIENP